jgi:hypothetical protein
MDEASRDYPGGLCCRTSEGVHQRGSFYEQEVYIR